MEYHSGVCDFGADLQSVPCMLVREEQGKRIPEGGFAAPCYAGVIPQKSFLVLEEGVNSLSGIALR